VSEHLPAGTEANHKQPVRIADLWVEIWTQNVTDMKQGS
jgi:hypothetical protein